MSYILDTTEIQSKLIASGLFTTEDVPSLESLDFLVEMLVPRFETWLGYSPMPKQYVQERRTNRKGLLILEELNIISIESVLVKWYEDTTIPNNPQWETLPVIWKGGDRIDTFEPEVLIKITYTAGYDPIPALFKNCFFDLIRKTIKESGISGDLSFLEEPIKDVSSISIPGISKSFRLSDKKGDVPEGSQLDRILSPLATANLRRKYRW